MKKWEYLYCYAAQRGGQNMLTNLNGNQVNDEEIELGAAMNHWGREGWELVGLTGVGETGWRFVFKRELEEA